MKKIIVLAAVAAMLPVSLMAQTAPDGGLSPEVLSRISKGYTGTSYDKAVRNALAGSSVNVMATNAENASMIDTHFSDRVKTKGITDQKSSGRCWLFTGLNVLRAKMIEKYNLGSFTFSQNYLFFYDQLEKANLFLQGVIDTRKLPFDDRKVDWLFSNPLSDGGQFTGVSDLAMKYGLVPSEVMPETYSSNNTSQMALQLKTILRQGGLALRAAYDASPAASAKGKNAAAAEAKVNAELLKIKESVLTDVYRILSLCLGVPPASFEWSMYDSSDKLVSTEEYTPLSFYKKYVDEDLDGNYVMLMNDPTREYGKVYEIDYDRHVYDGKNWLYVNLPIERIREVAAASIKDNTAMYFSCDVGKFLNSKKGVLDIANYDYESLFNVKYTMDKRERVLTHASGSSHAMTLIAVDIKDGVPQKWMVENSWGADSGYRGCLIMTDQWFAEYMFRVVAEKKYVPADILEMLSQKPTLLPAWDPMFTPEQ